MLKFIYYTLLLSLFSVANSVQAKAEIAIPPNKFGLPATTSSSGVGAIFTLIKDLITYGAFIISSIAIVFAVYGGFLYTTAHGNDEQAKKAKMLIVWVLVGLVISALSWSIVNILLGAEPFIAN